MIQEIDKYKNALAKAVKKIEELSAIADNETHDDIAIVGYSCRFPGGANNPEQFWQLLMDKRDAVVKVERFNVDEYYSEDMDMPGKMYTKEAALLNIPVDEFDNRHFDISAVEALDMDPQQRLLLEVSWEALENAGMDINKVRGTKTGVFIGMNSSDYFRAHVFSGDVNRITNYSLTGISHNAACGRLAYFYDFKGPAMTIDTACSSSLSALSVAVENLRKKECNMALVGGVNMILSPESFVALCKFHALSPDGRCKTFDESADGFGRGEGCGVIVLKTVTQAQADGDRIYGVIKGISVAQDGKTNGITAPNASSQQAVIKQALKDAKLSMDDIDYIETHGTGTPLGDSIEVQVLNSLAKTKKDALLIGAVKSNINHLEGASAMASIIKVLLALENKTIPASIHCENLNKNINLEEKVRVVQDTTKWDVKNKIRRAGISAFGFTGTLGHVIIEEPPKQDITDMPKVPQQILTLSAKDEESLNQEIINMKEYIKENQQQEISDICYSTNMCKSYLSHRFVAVGQDRESILKSLDKASAISDTQRYDGVFKNIVFLFTGQGSVYKEVGASLYNTSHVFREKMDLCELKFKEALDCSILDAIYSDKADDLLQQYSQAVIFSVEYALAYAWENLGIRPQQVMGHSIGEYAAACYAGVISLDDAVKMIVARMAAVQHIDIEGKMVGILTDAEFVESVIAEGNYKNVSIAAINAPENVTISGEREEVDELIKEIKKRRKVFIEQLQIKQPFHSCVMKEISSEFKNKISEIKYHEPTVEIIPTIKGATAEGEKLNNAEYWTKHLHTCVDFNGAIKNTKCEGMNIYIEIGGDATLSGLASQCLEDKESTFLPSLRKGINDYTQLFRSLGKLYLLGVAVDWKNFYKQYNVQLLRLPQYAFQRKRFWIDLKTDTSNNKGSYIDVPYQAVTDTDKHTVEVSTKVEFTKDRESLCQEVIELISDTTGIETSQLKEEDSLFTLGFDSLLVINLRRAILEKYQLDLTLNDFFLNLNTIGAIVNYIWEHRDQISVQARQEEEKIIYNTVPVKAADGSIDNYINSIHSQLEQLKGMVVKKEQGEAAERTAPTNINSAAMILKEEELTLEQQAFISDFIKKYNEKTKRSKQYAQDNRATFTDWINSLNLRKCIKDLFYPPVADHAHESHFWDIDGNEYLDISMGYGVNFLGHNPKFIADAVKQQIEEGFALGPQYKKMGEIVQLIKELTHVDRVAFCNTGSEAVMVSLRIARAYSGKKKIVKFAGAYHGTFDGVLSANDEEGVYPTSLGSTYGMVKDSVNLLYGTPESLEYIKAHKDEIAAVLVEPVQSRRPGFQPAEYLRELRKITEELGVILIFDEMVNGFRINVGGAQAHFGIRADIVTYGKIVGGGLPIGVVAGKKEYLDKIDGGQWQYGDESVPKSDTIVFAGTFCKHPLSMAAAHAALTYMKEQGNALQERTNAKTERFARLANAFFEQERVPIKVRYFGSQFRFESYGKYDLFLFPIEMDLFFYLLNYKGIYVWERRTCCFCIQITDEDIDLILSKIKESIYELRQGGFSFCDDEKTSISETAMPMSISQKRLFSNIMINEGDPYNIIGGLEINGKLDLVRLEKAIATIIERHESLRTKLYVNENDFLQEVEAKVDFEIEKIKQQPGEEIEEVIDANIRKFDLQKGRLIQVLLIETLENHEVLVFNLHHTIADGRSLDILGSELIQLYDQKTLPKLKYQYSDYIKWEKNFLESKQVEAYKKYWEQKLSGELAPIKLPLDYAKTNKNSILGETLTCFVDEALVTKLKKVAQESQVSLFMLLVAAFNVLIHKITQAEDIVIGTPVTDRGDGKFDENIGMFTNTILLRNKVAEEACFGDFLQDIKKNLVDAYTYMEYPFNLVADYINNVKQEDINDLLKVVFVYENIDKRVIKVDDLEIKSYDYHYKTSEFEFMTEILEEDGRFKINYNYKKELISKSSVERWSKYYERILEMIAACSREIKLSEIEVLDEADTKQILEVFNQTATDYEDQAVIQTLFERQAEQYPDKIAVVDENEQITYKELNKRANQLAYVLREHGVGADVGVAIMLPKSVELIIGVLAILKAGGAYVPIDTEYPLERVQFILNDCEAGVLISCDEYIGKVEFDGVVIDLLHDEFKDELSDNLNVINETNNLAYVIYTSGTTGKPKGVMCEHKNVIRLVNNTNYIEFKADDRILQTGSIVFDASTFEIWGALLNGLTLYLAPIETVAYPEHLETYVDKNNITILWLTSELFNQIAESNIGVFKNLRYLLVGGDVLSTKYINLVRGTYENLNIINGYGPTENTTFSTTYAIETAFDHAIPIGKPIANSKAYIVDQALRLVPVGVYGELCVSGDGLARGYLNRDELTKEKFIDNPFEAGKKMYRTGDLARWLADGNIEFAGRMDYQVKLRGYRIELGEIENALLRCEHVKEAVVLMKEDASGQKYLCAYLVYEGSIDKMALKESLNKTLPEYMIPAQFVQIDAMPLTSNKKVDRRALPEPNEEELITHQYEAPQNEVETKLVEMWKEVLKLNTISITDNFFELGGNSLNSIIVIGKIQKEFGIKVPIKEVFKHVNIKELAMYITSQESNASESIERVAESDYYIASSAQRRMYLSQEFNNGTVYNMFKGIEVQGKLDIEKLQEVIEMIVARHESLRTNFVLKDGEIVQIIHKPGERLFKVELLEADEETLETTVRAFIRPFDLKNDVLIRVGVIRLEEERNVIVFDLHHIISDGISIKVLIEEINMLYQDKCLDEITIQYKDYSNWENNRDKHESFKAQKAFWLEEFNKTDTQVGLPTDYERPKKRDFIGKNKVFSISTELTERIRELAKETNASIYMILLANLQIVLSKYNNQEDIVVGTPVAGRTHYELENVIGMFVNTVAIRSKVDCQMSFRQYLESVKEKVLNAIKNQDYQFEELIEALGIERDINRNPLFDVMFTYQNIEMDEIQIPGLQVKDYPINELTERFDMTITSYEQAKDILFDVSYCVALYKEETINRFSECYKYMLEEMLNNLDEPIDSFELMTRQEAYEVYENYNTTDLNEEELDFQFDF